MEVWLIWFQIVLLKEIVTTRHLFSSKLNKSPHTSSNVWKLLESEGLCTTFYTDALFLFASHNYFWLLRGCRCEPPFKMMPQGKNRKAKPRSGRLLAAAPEGMCTGRKKVCLLGGEGVIGQAEYPHYLDLRATRAGLHRGCRITLITLSHMQGHS